MDIGIGQALVGGLPALTIVIADENSCDFDAGKETAAIVFFLDQYSGTGGKIRVGRKHPADGALAHAF